MLTLANLSTLTIIPKLVSKFVPITPLPATTPSVVRIIATMASTCSTKYASLLARALFLLTTSHVPASQHALEIPSPSQIPLPISASTLATQVNTPSLTTAPVSPPVLLLTSDTLLSDSVFLYVSRVSSQTTTLSTVCLTV